MHSGNPRVAVDIDSVIDRIEEMQREPGMPDWKRERIERALEAAETHRRAIHVWP